MNNKYAIQNTITGKELRSCRIRLKMTQQALADFTGVSKKTIERWESSDEPVKGPVAPLLKLLSENPALLNYYEIPEKKDGIRLWYMFKDEICTLIDVNDRLRTVHIRNYTERMQFRAFGVNENPTYSDYEEFLRSRCFPESRDRLKLILKELDIPFYDPFLIIEKTEGRMAEDDFWFRIER